MVQKPPDDPIAAIREWSKGVDSLRLRACLLFDGTDSGQECGICELAGRERTWCPCKIRSKGRTIPIQLFVIDPDSLTLAYVSVYSSDQITDSSPSSANIKLGGSGFEDLAPRYGGSATSKRS